MPSPSDWKPSNPGQPITVNVDDWLANRNNLQQPQSAIPAAPKVHTHDELLKAREQAQRERKELREYLAQKAQEAQQASQVEKEDRDCSECGANHPHYIDDYMCIYCRSKLNG